MGKQLHRLPTRDTIGGQQKDVAHPTWLTAKEKADLLALIQDLEAKGWGDYLSLLMKGEFTELEFNENFYHWIWSALGQKTNLLTYRREKR